MSRRNHVEQVLAEVDQQHEQILALHRSAIQALLSGDLGRARAELLALHEAFAQHVLFEEQQFSLMRYNDAELHCNEHAESLAELEAILKLGDEHSALAAARVAASASKIVAHLLGCDAQFMELLRTTEEQRRWRQAIQDPDSSHVFGNVREELSSD
jgi:hemerythrin